MEGQKGFLQIDKRRRGVVGMNSSAECRNAQTASSLPDRSHAAYVAVIDRESYSECWFMERAWTRDPGVLFEIVYNIYIYV